MNLYKIVLVAGFAMFSMFFGSGNLVFPLEIGAETLGDYPYTIMGLILTGVVVPFLGLLGVILFDGNKGNFLQMVGRKPAFFLAFVMLALMGPLGVIPRCIVVAHGGVSLVWPGLSLQVFSLLFAGVTLWIVWNENKVVPILGKVLTPALLVGIGLLIAFGLIYAPEIVEVGGKGEWGSFKVGLLEGYQMMDLLAAFFFSATTVAFLRGQVRSDEDPRVLFRMGIYASLIGAVLLGLVYVGFVALGAKYAAALRSVNPEQMLSKIAGCALGDLAVPVCAVTIALACLTTAVALVQLFANFLNQDVCRDKLGERKAAVVTLVVSFFTSFLGFTKLKVVLGEILVVAYPALIGLTVANIFYKVTKVNVSRWVFWGIAGVSCLYKYLM